MIFFQVGSGDIGDFDHLEGRINSDTIEGSF